MPLHTGVAPKIFKSCDTNHRVRVIDMTMFVVLNRRKVGRNEITSCCYLCTGYRAGRRLVRRDVKRVGHLSGQDMGAPRYR